MAEPGNQPQNDPQAQGNAGNAPQQAPAPGFLDIENSLPDTNEPGFGQITPDDFSLPERREPYIYPSGLSHPSAWARDSMRLQMLRAQSGIAAGPWAPQIDEVRDLVRQNAMHFINNGSNPQKLRAARMLAYNDGYWKDYLNTKLTLARLKHEQYTAEEEQFLKNNRDMFREYSNAFAVFEKDNPATLPQLKERLATLARRFDDPDIERMAREGDIKGIERVISSRVNANEAQLHIQQQRLANEKTQQEIKNAEELAAERKRFLDPDPATSDPASAPSSVSTTPTTSTPTPGSTATPMPATPPPGARSVIDPAPPEYINTHYALPRASPELAAAARRVVETNKDFKHKDTVIQDAVNQRADLIKQKLAEIQSDPNIVGRDNTLAAIRLLDPTIANDVESYLHKSYPVSTRASSSGKDRLVIDLGFKADPGIKPEDYATRAAAEKSATSGQIRKDVIAIGAAHRHVTQYEKAIEKFNGLSASEQYAVRNFGTSVWNDYLAKIPLANRFIVSKEHQELAAALNNGQNIALNEVYKGASGGNAERGREAAQRLADWKHNSAAALRYGVEDLREYLDSRLKILENNFKEAGGEGHFLTLFRPGGEARKGLEDPREDTADLNAIPGIGPAASPGAAPATPPPPTTRVPKGGDIIINPTTGERLRRTNDGRWEPVR